ncbi:MAG TPA: c-type cytochrome biogenesis protein CcmI, partial [Thalassospira lucentensis]
MTIAIVLGAVTLLVAGFVLWPIWINRKQAQSVRSDAKENPSDTNTDSKPDTAPDILGADDEILRDLAVYQDQLSEIDRDIDRGVLTTEQASAARIEVQRRILNADQRIKEQSAAQINIKGSPRLRPLIAGLVALFLIGGVGLYLDLG